MPQKPLRSCPGKGPRRSICKNLISSSARCCPECEPFDKQVRKRYDEQRGTSAERGYDYRWRKVREWKLAANPLCELCFEKGIVTPATMVHHIISIEERPDLRLVESNLQSCCNPCHEELEKEGRWNKNKSY